MPKRPPPDLTPLAVLIPPILARAIEGPRAAAQPVAAVPVRRYRSRYYIHPGQLPFQFPEEAPDGSRPYTVQL